MVLTEPMQRRIMKGSPAGFMMLALAGALLCCLAFGSLFPGMSNPDIANEYIGLQMQSYSDWHPPMMAFIWSLIASIVSGKAGLFVLFTIVYSFCAFGLLLCALQVSPIAAGLTLVVLVFPGFLTQGGMLFKDFLMAAFLGLAVALGHYQPDWRRAAAIVTLLGAVAAAFAGALMRANAPFAAGAVLVGCASCFLAQRARSQAQQACERASEPLSGNRHRPKLKAGRPLAFRPIAFLTMSVVAAGLLIPVNAAINELAFRPMKMSVTNSLFIFDMAGITQFSGKNVFPEEVKPAFSVQDNASCYTPLFWDPFIDWRDFRSERFGSAEAPSVAFIADPKFAACQAVWRTMRRANVDQGRSFLRD